MQPKVFIRKRTQISMANKTMFIWVAGVSVLFGFALVASIFLVQKLMFNERVIAEKNKTISTLEESQENIKTLQHQIELLELDENLKNVKNDPNDNALTVILDALPHVGNSTALGSSLQNKLLKIDELDIKNINMTPIAGVEETESIENGLPADALSTGSSVSQNLVNFTFDIAGDAKIIEKALLNLERSIRTIDATYLVMTAEDVNDQTTGEPTGKYTLTVRAVAHAFYEPAVEYKLSEKMVK